MKKEFLIMFTLVVHEIKWLHLQLRSKEQSNSNNNYPIFSDFQIP